jgi:hypothetical protein
MKNPSALIALTFTVLLSGFESHAQLGTIATAHRYLTSGFRAITDDSFHVTFGYAPTNTTSVFTQFTFHTNDVGSVFSIDQFSDPGFLGFLSRATNGIADNVLGNYTIGSGETFVIYGAGGSETTFFTSFPYGRNGWDLVGFQIERIDLTLNSLEFNSPGSNPFGDGNWTDFGFDFTLSFIGVVPPPPVLGNLSYSGAPGQFQFTLTGEANATYVILSSTNLVDWLPVATNTSSLAVRQITNSVSGSRTFFRARLEP